MIISDLSYLNEISEETVSGGWDFKFDFDFDKDIDVDVDVDVDSEVNAKGAFNELAFDLTAFGGYGSGTEVVVKQQAIYDGGYISTSNGTVVSFAR